MKDPQWAGDIYDSTKAHISKEGCLLTCFSMISGINPRTLNQQFVSNGIYDVGGLIKTGDAANFLGFTAEAPISFSDAALFSAILEPDVLIFVEVRTGTRHFVLVTGYEGTSRGCRYRIADPAGTHDYLDQYAGMLSIRRFLP